MNNKGFWKVLMVSLVMASAIGLLARGAKAQNIPTQQLLQDELGIQVGGTVLLDNFQYWNPPRDMGWTPIEPAYPIYGAGIGLGSMETVVDFQEGSRVMDVFSPPSLFLPMGTNQFMPYTATKMANYRGVGGAEWKGIPGIFNVMSFKLRAPLAIEQFDTFSVIVRVRTLATPLDTTVPPDGVLDVNVPADNDGDGAITIADAACGTFGGAVIPGTPTDVPLGATTVCGTAAPAFGVADLVFVPRDNVVGCTPNSVVINPRGVAISANPATLESAIFNPGGTLKNGASVPQIQVALGREFQDGSWHYVSQELNTILAQNAGAASEMLFEVLSVTVRGNQYRLDDVMFTNSGVSIENNIAPYLFRIGPVYGQLFNVGQSRFINAEDVDNFWLFSTNALLAKATLNPKVASMLGRNGLAASLITAGDLPFIRDNAGLGITNGMNPLTARFSLGGNDMFGYGAAATGGPQLNFEFTVGDALGPASMSIGQQLPVAQDVDNSGTIDASDVVAAQLPPELPSLGVPRSAWIRNTGAADVTNPMYVMACALVNSGYRVWPNLRILTPSQGQVLEDLIITCRVSDSVGVTDTETFPISVVNYPVTNLPPQIEQLEDQFFQVGTEEIYQITAEDPDPQDMAAGLTYRATLNGLPNYQYGPWMDQIIDPIMGTVRFTPQFEGTITCMVTVTDARGAQAVGHFNIFCVNPGTWLNHPPSVLEIIESPQMVRAGQLFTISDLRIADPDNQQLYYSCNIGSVGRNGIYTFQSEFPGEYLVQITGYDIVGGAVTQQFVLQVLPWWSY